MEKRSGRLLLALVLHASLAGSMQGAGSDPSMCATVGLEGEIMWPADASAVQPLLLEQDGVRAQLIGDGGRSSESGDGLLRLLLLSEGGAVGHRYVEAEVVNGGGAAMSGPGGEGGGVGGQARKFASFKLGRVPDGPLQLKLHYVAGSGCVHELHAIAVRVERDMGMREPPCDGCIFTSGWATAHFVEWRRFFLAAHHAAPPLQPGSDVLEIGSYEGMSGIWMFSNLQARTVTCVDTWHGFGGGRHACREWGRCNGGEVLASLEERFDLNMRAAGS